MPEYGEPLAAEARAIGATCGGVRVWSLYVPNGRTLDDPHSSTSSTGSPGCATPPPAGSPTTPTAVALMGDWNIAPQDDDVWTWRLLEGTHVSPAASGRPSRASWTPASPTSCARTHPGPGVYTYWDYTRLRFPKQRGMRIDFVLGSPALASRVDAAPRSTARSARARAPDHAPVVVELAG